MDYEGVAASPRHLKYKSQLERTKNYVRKHILGISQLCSSERNKICGLQYRHLKNHMDRTETANTVIRSGKTATKPLHKNNIDFQCEDCYCQAALESNLISHIKVVHDNIRDFKWVECD